MNVSGSIIVSLLSLSLSLFSFPAFSKDLMIPSYEGGYANPQDGNVLFADYYILVNIGHGKVNELFINLPQEIGILNGVNVTDRDGRIIAMNYTMNKDSISIRFAQPLHQENLKIMLKSVKYPIIKTRTLLFYLSARLNGESNFIPFGTARINLYD